MLAALRENYRVPREGMYLIQRGVSGRTTKLRGDGWIDVSQEKCVLAGAKRDREGVGHLGPETASAKALWWENVAWHH